MNIPTDSHYKAFLLCVSPKRKSDDQRITIEINIEVQIHRVVYVVFVYYRIYLHQVFQVVIYHVEVDFLMYFLDAVINFANYHYDNLITCFQLVTVSLIITNYVDFVSQDFFHISLYQDFVHVNAFFTIFYVSFNFSSNCFQFLDYLYLHRIAYKYDYLFTICFEIKQFRTDFNEYKYLDCYVYLLKILFHFVFAFFSLIYKPRFCCD